MRRTILFLLFFPASLGIISQIFSPENLSAAILALTVAACSLVSLRAEDKPKAKAYPLDKCLVSDEKFEGSGMETYEFVHEGQTIKLCCKSCLKDFKKDPASHLKKLPKAKGPKTAQ
jgi:hypothetical protein